MKLKVIKNEFAIIITNDDIIPVWNQYTDKTKTERKLDLSLPAKDLVKKWDFVETKFDGDMLFVPVAKGSVSEAEI